jgi:hypothetical protein
MEEKGKIIGYSDSLFSEKNSGVTRLFSGDIQDLFFSPG